jgi:predicted GNAT superfamily acetyltransferase
MTTLASLRRPAKWRKKVREELDATLKEGHKIYGVRRDGKYVVKTSSEERVIPKRNVKGSIVANRALAD